MENLSFDLNHSFIFYKGGKFHTEKKWAHSSLATKKDYELIFCTHGTLDLLLGKQNVTVKANEWLLIPPHTAIKGAYKKKQQIEFYWLHFFQEKPSPDLPSSNRITLPRHFHVNDENQSILLIQQILAYHPLPQIPDSRNFLLASLLIELYSRCQLEQKTNRPQEEHLESIKEWIRSHMSATLTVEEIAEHAYFNAEYLTRLFKRYTGLTAHQYLTHLKIETAKTLLVTTQLSIQDIAVHAYFSSDKAMFRTFKKSVGVTPSAYRYAYSTIHLNNPQIDPKIPIPKEIYDKIIPN